MVVVNEEQEGGDRLGELDVLPAQLDGDSNPAHGEIGLHEKHGQVLLLENEHVVVGVGLCFHLTVDFLIKLEKYFVQMAQISRVGVGKGDTGVAVELIHLVEHHRVEQGLVCHWGEAEG